MPRLLNSIVMRKWYQAYICDVLQNGCRSCPRSYGNKVLNIPLCQFIFYLLITLNSNKANCCLKVRLFLLATDYICHFNCCKCLIVESYIPMRKLQGTWEVVTRIATFESVAKTLWCDHSNETFLAVLSQSTIRFSAFYKIQFGNFVEFLLWPLLLRKIHLGRPASHQVGDSI